MDPLDIIVGLLALIIATIIYFIVIGYVYSTLLIFGIFAGLAWHFRPRKYFPTGEAICKDVDMTDKVVLITGPTSGIGKETARVLALRGAHVVLASRNKSKLDATKKDLEVDLADSGRKGKFSVLECDLNDLDSVKACAEAFLEMDLPLNLLITNAGIMAVPERRETKQGFEQQVGVNHVGHFLLTKLLLPKLQESAPSRVVVLSSIAHNRAKPVFLDHPKLETEPYEPGAAYGNSKLSNMLMAAEIHNQFYDGGRGVTAFSVMPGGIHTGLQIHVPPYLAFKWAIVTPFFFKSIEQGAATTLLCATNADPETDGGKYFDNCKPTSTLETWLKQIGKDAPSKLWKRSEQLVEEYL